MHHPLPVREDRNIYILLGTVKWKRLQRSAPVLEAEPPMEEFMDARKRLIEAMGLNVMIH